MRCRRAGRVRTPTSVRNVAHRVMEVVARFGSAFFSNSLDDAGEEILNVVQGIADDRLDSRHESTLPSQF